MTGTPRRCRSACRPRAARRAGRGAVPEAARLDWTVGSRNVRTGRSRRWSTPSPLGTRTDRRCSTSPSGSASTRGGTWPSASPTCPLRVDGGPLVADVAASGRVALVSIPALGGFWLRHRAREAVVRIIGQLTGHEDESVDLLPEPTGPLAATTPSTPTVARRVIATGARGRLRLLAGMLRANQPWRLVPSLSGALVGALATSAVATVNSTVVAGVRQLERPATGSDHRADCRRHGGVVDRRREPVGDLERGDRPTQEEVVQHRHRADAQCRRAAAAMSHCWW